VFTARFALNPYIEQRRFIFKRSVEHRELTVLGMYNFVSVETNARSEHEMFLVFNTK